MDAADPEPEEEPETTNGGLASVGYAGASKGKLTAKEKRAMKNANRKQKRTEANKEKRKGGFVRLESRAEAGAFAGNGGRKRTCLPDAITAALGMLGVVVDKTTVRDAIAPDWKKKNAADPSVADAEAYLHERHGKVLTPQAQMCSNPHALFSVRGGPQLRVFIAELLLGGEDKHFAVYNSDGQFGDNQPHVIPIMIQESDLEGGNKTAIAAMLGLWGGAVTSASLVNAYELGV